MTQDLPPVQMLWVGGPLTALERLSLTSYLRQGHPVHLYTYGRPANVPKGLTIKDAATILPCPAGEDGNTVAARFSDRCRSKLLFERGGIWSDIDVVCVKPLEFARGMDYFFASEVIPAQAGDEGKIRVRASNCVMKTPAASPVMQDCLQQADAASNVVGSAANTGPVTLHAALERYNLLGALLNPNLFCPVPFWNFTTLMTGTATLPPESCGVHCWSESWRRNFFDRDGTYEPLSLIERLKAHYLATRLRKEA